MSAVNLNHLRSDVELLRWVKARKAELADVERRARTNVENALGDNETGMLDDELAITWKTQKRRTLNQKAIKSDHPELVESYYETAEVRRFEIHE